MRTTRRSTIAVALLLAALLLMAVVPAAQAAPETAPAASCGYWYTVQSGQGWYSVSAATGVSVPALQAANPGKVRPPNNWLYVGESLWIPCGAPPPPPPPSCGYWYTVQPGQGWYSVSAVTGVSVWSLQAANPGKVRPPNSWLYAGEKLWIPCGAPPPPPPPPPPSSCSYWYTVQAGQGWYSVSAATGVSVSALQACNPGKVRPPNYWLYTGEKLCIP